MCQKSERDLAGFTDAIFQYNKAGFILVSDSPKLVLGWGSAFYTYKKLFLFFKPFYRNQRILAMEYFF